VSPHHFSPHPFLSFPFFLYVLPLDVRLIPLPVNMKSDNNNITKNWKKKEEEEEIEGAKSSTG
jgi:hypothetical protein